MITYTEENLIRFDVGGSIVYVKDMTCCSTPTTPSHAPSRSYWMKSDLQKPWIVQKKKKRQPNNKGLLPRLHWPSSISSVWWWNEIHRHQIQSKTHYGTNSSSSLWDQLWWIREMAASNSEKKRQPNKGLLPPTQNGPCRRDADFSI